jgi:quercetin dioxygenase-like cupin family protein
MVFDLEASWNEMQHEAASSATGHTARTLIHERDLRVVLVVLAPGGRIKEHRAHSATSIHVLRGSIDVGLGEQSVNLSASRLLSLERDLPHSVAASEEAALLLTLGQSS